MCTSADAQINQWISRSGWKDQGDGYIFVANQEDNIKTKNITEKITFEGESHMPNRLSIPSASLKFYNVTDVLFLKLVGVAAIMASTGPSMAR